MDAVDELNFLLGIGPPRPNLPLTIRKSSYTSIRDLGKGTYGQAILAFHKIRNQYYVIKHINMSKMNSKQRKDAHKEISILQQLDHPNIVRYVEYFEEFPHLYIVMEYADGGDLTTHLNRIKNNAKYHLVSQSDKDKNTLHQSNGLLTEPQVMSLFVQATIALKHMHDRRLLHRDIKSQNIFLTRNHVVKLGDFGISTVLKDTVAMASTMCGTPCYFSPEICLGKPYNNKSDVWALGVLLYEMCANRLPFESPTMKALMNEILKNEPRRIPRYFSEELWELIRWMLNKDPKRRPDAQQVLMSSIVMRHMPTIIEKLKSVENGENYYEPVSGEKITQLSPLRDKAINRDAPFPIYRETPIDSGKHKISELGAASKRLDALPLNDQQQHKPGSQPPLGLREKPKSTDHPMKSSDTNNERDPLDDQASYNIYGAASLLQQQNQVGGKADKGTPYQPIYQGLSAQIPGDSAQGKDFKGKEADLAKNLSDLTPGQRAAQEVQLMQQQKRRGPESAMLEPYPAEKAGEPVKFLNEANAKPVQANSADQLPISALIEAYDLEKKKMANLRQKGHHLNQKQTPVAPLNRNIVDNAHQLLMRGHKPPEDASGVRGPVRKASSGARLPPMGEPGNQILPKNVPSGRPLYKNGNGRGNSHPSESPLTDLPLRFLTPQYTPTKIGALYRAPVLPPLPALNECAAEEPKDKQYADLTQVELPLPQEEEKVARNELNDVVHEMSCLLSHFTMSMRGAEDKGGNNDAETMPSLEIKRSTESNSATRDIGNSAVTVCKSVKGPSVGAKEFPSPLSAFISSGLINEEQLEIQPVSEEFLDPLGTRLDVEKLQAQPQQCSPLTKIPAKEPRQVSEESSTLALSGGNPRITLGSCLEGQSVSTAATKSTRCGPHSGGVSSDLKHAEPYFDWGDEGGGAQLRAANSSATSDSIQNARSIRVTSSPLGNDTNVISTVVKDVSKSVTRDNLNALLMDSALKHFNGSCLCGGARIQGLFSNIYGSFACACIACCRVSSSRYGIEWLHLPKINHIGSVLNRMYPDAAAAINTEDEDEARVSTTDRADAAADGGNGRMVPMEHSPGVLLAPSEYNFTVLLDVDSDNTSEDIGRLDVDVTNFYDPKLDKQRTSSDGSSGRSQCDAADLSSNSQQLPRPRQLCRKEEGHFKLHFCPTCGCVLGMEHDGVDGLLLSKLMLNQASVGVLLQFERMLDRLYDKA